MPTHEQLRWVRERADQEREVCRSAFLRVWPDEAAFERCWQELAKEARQVRRYDASKARTGLVITSILLAATLPVVLIGEFGDSAVPSGLWRWELLLLGAWIYQLVRFWQSRR